MREPQFESFLNINLKEYFHRERDGSVKSWWQLSERLATYQAGWWSFSMRRIDRTEGFHQENVFQRILHLLVESSASKGNRRYRRWVARLVADGSDSSGRWRWLLSDHRGVKFWSIGIRGDVLFNNIVFFGDVLRKVRWIFVNAMASSPRPVPMIRTFLFWSITIGSERTASINFFPYILP